MLVSSDIWIKGFTMSKENDYLSNLKCVATNIYIRICMYVYNAHVQFLFVFLSVLQICTDCLLTEQ